MAIGRLDQDRLYQKDIFDALQKGIKDSTELLVGFEGRITELSAALARLGDGTGDIRKLVTLEQELKKVSKTTLTLKREQAKLEADLNRARQQQTKSMQAEAAAERELAKVVQEGEKANQQAARTQQQRLKTSQEEEKVTQQQIRSERELARAAQEAEKVKQQEERTEQQQIKTKTDLIKAEKEEERLKGIQITNAAKLAKEKEREAKAAAKVKQALDDESNAFKRLSKDTNAAQANFKRLAAEFGLNSKQARAAGREFRKFDDRLRAINEEARDGRRDVGRYEKALRGVRGVLSALGVTFAISEIARFGRALIDANNELKGVEFAFERLGFAGRKAFDDVKTSTRGLVADLDIKRALVDFDNFNISLEDSGALFEFLSVRAAQTGKSVEFLRDSLVEGLSKESKLRIDNLGISAGELNDELAKTPNFVTAVANIAKREVAEAGAILDEAANAQQLWNVRLENTKNSLAQTVSPAIDVFYRLLNLAAENIRGIVIGLGGAVVAFTAYVAVTKRAIIASKLFNTVSRANPLGLIVTALGALIPLLISYTSKAADATRAQTKFNDAIERGRDLLREFDTLLSEGGSLEGFSQEQLKSFISDSEAALSALSDIERKQIAARAEVIAKVRAQNKDLVAEFSRLKATRDADPLGRTLAGQQAIANFADVEKRLTDLIQKEEINRFGITTRLAAEKKRALAKELAQARSLLKADGAKRLGLIQEIDKEIADLRKKQQETRDKREILALKEDIADAEERKRKLLGVEKEFIEELDKLIVKSLDKIPELITETEDAVAKALRDALKAIRDNERREAVQRLEAQKKFVNEVADTLDSIDRLKENALKRDIDRNKTQLDDQRKRAEEGKNNELNFRRQRDAELEALAEKRAKREFRRQKALAYYNLLIENAKTNPDTAVARSAQQIAFSEIITSLYKDGTEFVGKNGETKWRNTGTDDYVVGVDEGERILTRQQNKRVMRSLGDISNEDLTKMLEGRQGAQLVPVGTSQGVDLSPVVDGLSRVEQGVKGFQVNIAIDKRGVVTKEELRGALKYITRQKL